MGGFTRRPSHGAGPQPPDPHLAAHSIWSEPTPVGNRRSFTQMRALHDSPSHLTSAAEPRVATRVDPPGDDVLLGRLLQRDILALEAIYDRHIASAWRVALAAGADERSAADAVRAAFLRLWREPASVAGWSLCSWLLATVTREARGAAPRGLDA